MASNESGTILLGHEQQIVQEVLEADALVITAAGLGWQRVVAALLRLHQDVGAAGSGGAEEVVISPMNNKAAGLPMCACILTHTPMTGLASPLSY
jgi:hypothetical protein